MGDDLVARANAEGHEGQPDGIGAVAEADGVFSAVISSEFGFKLLEHGPHDVLAALQNRLDILINLRLDIMVLSDVPVEFNFHGAGNYSIAAQKQIGRA